MADASHDYSKTLSLPKTDFSMRANAAQREPAILKSWEGDYDKLRSESRDRRAFVLHDGPPYANGNIHIGHALNKIIKDIIVRSKQNDGFDAHFVPGWDCHGLPIEWAVEKQYREKGLNKSAVPVVEFRRECRAFARQWVDVQKEQFKRLGIRADWDRAYETMSFDNEAAIAGRFMSFVSEGLVYRGSRPVLWSPVEQTALAEAEVEYKNVTSDTVYFSFKLKNGSGMLRNARIIAYTTTPWTIPANRALAYSDKASYGLYRVTRKGEGSLVDHGTLLILADRLADEVMTKAGVGQHERVQDVSAETLAGLAAEHPFHRTSGYEFDVPLLAGDHVTDDLGTGFVHTAPSHGAEDYALWQAHRPALEARGIDTAVPHLVGPDGAYTDSAGDLKGHYVYEPSGAQGKANQIVVGMLMFANAMVAGIKLHNHSYPHSWRSGTPLIYRSTHQWFIDVTANSAEYSDSLRVRSLSAIDQTKWVPTSSSNRIRSMMESRPDWLVSRQRAWGVPLSVFANEQGDILVDDAVNQRILAAYREDGTDAWFAEGARERFLGDRASESWQPLMDVLDVWFDSGCSHLFVGPPRSTRAETLVVEGSDQHRGWFQSSLLANFGIEPFDTVLTHGFVLDGEKEKMSKKLGNVMSPDALIKASSADIVRLWVASSDYQNDVSLSSETIKTVTESYRKLRNTLRWMLGVLTYYKVDSYEFDHYGADRPLIECNMLDRAYLANWTISKAYAAFDFKTVVSTINNFVSNDLSAYYFDIRKDAIYCDAPSSARRQDALMVVLDILVYIVKWIEPILPFLAHDVVDHLPEATKGAFAKFRLFRYGAKHYDDEAVRRTESSDRAKLFKDALPVRERVLATLERAREQKLIGSPLEAAVAIRVGTRFADLSALDWAELCVVSKATVEVDPSLDGIGEETNISVVRAEGRKCARSWKYSLDVGSDNEYPDVTPRDAAALREIKEAAVGS